MELYLQQPFTPKERKERKAHCEHYLKRCGFPPPTAAGLIATVMDGKPVTSSDSYPEIWKHAKAYNVELDHFATLPMHGCALGVEKNLIHQTPRLVTRKKRKENEFWSDLKFEI